MILIAFFIVNPPFSHNLHTNSDTLNNYTVFPLQLQEKNASSAARFAVALRSLCGRFAVVFTFGVYARFAAMAVVATLFAFAYTSKDIVYHHI